MSRSKVPYEAKVRIVQRYLNGEVGYRESVKVANNSASSFRQWVAQYRVGGGTALLSTDRNKRYSAELKAAAVKEYLSGKGSQEAICLKYEIRSHHQLHDWIKVYNTHGDFNSVRLSGGGSYMKQGRYTTQEERIQIARECIASGKNYGEMALKYDVSYQQARTWAMRFEELGEAGLQDRRGRRKRDQTPRTELERAQIEIEQLKHKLYLSEMENTLLKKLDEVERRDASHK